MDPMTMAMAAAVGGTILQVQGNLRQADAMTQAGQRAKTAKEFEAAQLQQNAIAAKAAAQRKSAEQERRSRLVASRALAVSAASGAGASDPTIQTIISDIAGEGAYRAGLELYQGEERARQLRMGADAALYEGNVAEQAGKEKAQAYKMQAIGSALAGGGSLYAKYGLGGPGMSKSDYLDAGTPTDARFG